MKLLLTKKVTKGVFTSDFSLIEISEKDQKMLDLVGDVDLNIQGNVTKTEMVDDSQGGQVGKETILLRQGDKYIKFASALPFQKVWLKSQLGENTQEIAELETAQIAKRIQDIVDKMILENDTFSGTDEIVLTQ